MNRRRGLWVTLLLLAAAVAGLSVDHPEPGEPTRVRPAEPVAVAVAVVRREPVRCADTLGMPEGSHELIELFGDGEGQLSVATVAAGEVVLDVVQSSGRGGIYVIGWRQTVVAWEDGRCRFLLEGRATTAVVGIVEDAADLPRFAVTVGLEEVDGDGSSREHREVDADGSFYVELAVGPTYRLDAAHNGDWPHAGPTVEVTPVAGRDTVITLRLPETAGGLGLLLEEDPETYTVRDVLTGTPADRARLRAGDVILEVDGGAPDADRFALDPTRTDSEYAGRWLVRGRSGQERALVFGSR